MVAVVEFSWFGFWCWIFWRIDWFDLGCLEREGSCGFGDSGERETVESRL